MKLRNKKTGEIADLSEGFIRDTYNGEMIQIKPVAISNKEGYVYSSLAELTAEWEDYEGPKSGIEDIRLNDMISGRHIVEIDFTKVEEAEKAVEKLKAWKRLKDKGFEFRGYTDDSEDLFSCQVIRCRFDDFGKESRKDIDLLFGGKE